MQKIVETVSPLDDTERVIEFYKSGAVCSLDTLDHALVDLSQVKHNFNTIKKYKSTSKISSSTSDKDCQSLYQLKRKIQSKINALEDEIVKGKRLIPDMNQNTELRYFSQGGKKCPGCS